jgi:CBS domain-containing protein
MSLAALCQRAIVTVDAHRPLRDAAQAMLEHHVGAVVVTSSSEGRPEVVGVLTDRDLAIACVARALDPAKVLSGAVASGPVICIAASRGLPEAVEAMRSAGVRRLLVRDDERQVIGLLSSDDLLAALLEPLHALAMSYGTGIENERTRGNGAACDLEAGPLFVRHEQATDRG